MDIHVYRDCVYRCSNILQSLTQSLSPTALGRQVRSTCLYNALFEIDALRGIVSDDLRTLDYEK